MRSTFALVAALTLLATTGSVGLMPRATPPASPAWGPDVPLAPPDAPGATPNSEVSIAIDPTDPLHLVAGTIDNSPLLSPTTRAFPAWRDVVHTSDDGGLSWTTRGAMVPVGSDGQPMVCDDPVEADPSVVFGPDGTAYFSYLSYDGGDPTVATPCPDWTLSVARSTDHGATWGASVVVDQATPDFSCYPDRDALAIDRSSGELYLTWAGIGCGGDPLFASHSTDGGTTWSTRVPVSAPDDIEPYGAAPQVAPDGALMVAYYRATAFTGCPYFIGLTSTTSLVSAETVIAVTRDQGATWTRHVAGPVCDDEYQTTEDPFDGGADFSWPSLGVDPETGLAAVAWSNRDRPTTNVHVSISSDDGVSWSAPVAVGDLGRSAYMPAVAVAGGVVHLEYLSMLSTGNYDARYRSSSDGVSWSAPFVLGSVESCNCWGSATDPTVGGRIGDYMGIDARAGHVVAAWPDDRDPTLVETIHARSAALG